MCRILSKENHSTQLHCSYQDTSNILPIWSLFHFPRLCSCQPFPQWDHPQSAQLQRWRQMREGGYYGKTFILRRWKVRSGLPSGGERTSNGWVALNKSLNLFVLILTCHMRIVIVSPFGLLWQNTTQWKLTNNRNLFLTVLQAGSLRSGCQRGGVGGALPDPDLFW